MKLAGTFVVICCGLSFIIACKKSENISSNNNNSNNNNSPTKRQILESGKWQVSGGTATMNYMGKDTTADIYKDMAECDKDDFILFASDGTGIIDESANKCANDQQIESFTWILLSNDTKLALIDSNPDTVEIVDITSTNMVLKQIKPNSSGTPIIWARTYKNIR